MKDKELETKKEILSTPNSIARGRYGIGDKENKLFLKIMYAIQRDNREYIITKKLKEDLSLEETEKWNELCQIETLNCRIKHKDIEEIFKKKADRTKESMTDTFKVLKNCEISFDTITRDKKKATMVAGLIDHYYIEKETGDYIVVVPAKLYRYMFDLGLGYTQNALEIIYSLRGIYAQRMYLILRSWSGVKSQIYFSIKDLREMLKCTDSNKTFNSFETNVIKRAINEINKAGIMKVDILEKHKKGRNIEGITFKVVDKEPRNYLSLFPQKEKEDKSVIWLDYIKVENQDLLERLLRKYQDRDLSSPIVRAILCKAFDKTLNKDNRFTMIQDKKNKTNFTLFNHIVADEFLYNEIVATMNHDKDYMY